MNHLVIQHESINLKKCQIGTPPYAKYSLLWFVICQHLLIGVGVVLDPGICL